MRKSFVSLFSAGLALSVAGLLAGCDTTTTTTSNGVTSTTRTLDTNDLAAIESAGQIILANLPADAAAAITVAQAVSNITATVHATAKP